MHAFYLLGVASKWVLQLYYVVRPYLVSQLNVRAMYSFSYNSNTERRPLEYTATADTRRSASRHIDNSCVVWYSGVGPDGFLLVVALALFL